MNNEQLIVNASVPAQVLEIPNSTFNLNYHNDFTTHVKLRVFYQGMTKDKRLFTEEFSDKLLETLPQTPVVGYFDEESEDFVGHNHTQFIYGYVPESAEFGFETDDDGTKWAVTDIVLFTGRKDNIGQVAQKIIGKQHSLELDSSTMKYSIRRDTKGQLQHVELLEGKFIGLSVLGDDQSPAFEGSGFFAENKETEVLETYKEVANKVHQFLSNVNNGGAEVEKENLIPKEVLAQFQDFMRVTDDEVQQELIDAAAAVIGEYVWIMQTSVTDQTLVYVDFETGQYYRINYVKDEAGYHFSEKLEVKARFLTEEEINQLWPSPANATEVVEETIAVENEIPTVSTETVELSDITVATEVVTKLADTSGGVENEKEDSPQGFFISESERIQIENDRQELEEFRKERKQIVIDKYVDFLDQTTIQSFKAKLDNYTIEELELALSKLSMEQILKQKDKEKPAAIGAYIARTMPKSQDFNGQNQGSHLERLVKTYKE